MRDARAQHSEVLESSTMFDPVERLIELFFRRRKYGFCLVFTLHSIRETLLARLLSSVRGRRFGLPVRVASSLLCVHCKRPVSPSRWQTVAGSQQNALKPVLSK